MIKFRNIYEWLTDTLFHLEFCVYYQGDASTSWELYQPCMLPCMQRRINYKVSERKAVFLNITCFPFSSYFYNVLILEANGMKAKSKGKTQSGSWEFRSDTKQSGMSASYTYNLSCETSHLFQRSGIEEDYGSHHPN